MSGSLKIVVNVLSVKIFKLSAVNPPHEGKMNISGSCTVTV